MECRDKEKWNKDFDKLSEDEITELLSHSIFCDYHNCLVTEYERSVLPALDLYYEEKAAASVKSKIYTFFHDLHRILVFAFSQNPENFNEKREIYRSFTLLKRLCAINMAQTVIILLLAIASFAALFFEYSKTISNQIPAVVSTGHFEEHLKTAAKNPVAPASVAAPVKSEYSVPDAAPPKQVNPTVLSRGGQAYVQGYSIDSDKVIEKVKENEGKDQLDTTVTNQIETDREQMSKKRDEDRNNKQQNANNSSPVDKVRNNQGEEQNVNRSAENQNLELKKRPRFVEMKSSEANKITFRKGNYVVILNNWTKYGQLMNSKNIEMTPVSLRLISNTNLSPQKISGFIPLNGNSSLKIDFKPNAQGFYTFEIPKGEDCLITVENSETAPKTMLIQSSTEKTIKVVMSLDKQNP